MEETNNRSLPSRQHVICQLARMGDLVQALPLFNVLCESGSLNLICDQVALDWADLLPGVDRVFPLDTRRWRKTAADERLDLHAALVDLQADLGDIISLGAERCFPMNDHPLCDRLAASICEENPQRWLNHRLVMIRSYLRFIVSERRWSRVHLSDIWRSLAGESKTAEIPHIPATDEDRQFAREVLNAHRTVERRPLVAFILGSGSRYRRIDPEDLSAWWKAIPEGKRPGCVLIGGKGEEELGQRFLQAAGPHGKGVINLVGSCTPGRLLGIFNQVDLAVGVDTGPLHWAAATGARILGLYFGEAGFHETGPYGDGHLVLAPDCGDYPCGHQMAQSCGFRCLQMLKNPKTMADLLMSSMEASSSAAPKVPPGCHLYRSRWSPVGQKYETLKGGENSPEVITFSNFVRCVLNDIRVADDRECHPETLTQTFGAECVSQFQCGTVDVLIKNWLRAIKDLPIVRMLPKAIAEKVKLDSIEYLNNQKALFLASDRNESFMRV